MKNIRTEYEEAAKKEPPFDANRWAADIKPLIDYYFVGEFSLEENKIVCKFLNGQIFNITIEEIKE